MSTLYDGVLSEDELLDCMVLLNAYNTFWDNKLAATAFERSDVEHLLEEAAEIVIQIRSLCQKQGKPFPSEFPLVGMAREYLYNLEKLPAEDEFVRSIIHATLKHSTGYIGDLTEEEVDALIVQVVSYDSSREQSKHYLTGQLHEGKELLQKVQQNILRTQELLEGIKPEGILWTSSLVRDAGTLNGRVEELNHLLNTFQKRCGFKSDQTSKLHSLCADRPTGTPASTPKREKVTGKTEGMIAIERVAQEVDQLAGGIKGLEESLVGMDKQKLTDASNALSFVQDLKKKGGAYLDQLMADLLKLDSISGEEVRNERKKQVTHIQELMDSIEAMQGKLGQLEVELKSRAEKAQLKKQQEQREKDEKMAAENRSREEAQRKKQFQMEKERLEAEQKSLAQQRRRAVEERTRKEQEEKENKDEEMHKQLATTDPETFNLADAWKRLRLEVEFQTLEQEDGYLLVGTIPGMKEEDIKIKITADSKFVVSGFRGPTQQEIDVMNRILLNKYKFETKEDHLIALLKMGVGRFGTFEEVFRLPASVDSSKIRAQYVNGNLKIFLPKKVTTPNRIRPTRPTLPSDYRYPPERMAWSIPPGRDFFNHPLFFR
eukprot:TRINITY_DN6167_c0_g1_i1.p1 TRINITY_DN6167_c0_g1~~TRINITY_DN6167_c0_g1_i1.p1  ORF type:complete len:603 (-),score=179.42 TRINITY_DN6167_c0_g1_i1:142-1950(-)